MKNAKKYKNLCTVFVLVLICAILILSAGCSGGSGILNNMSGSKISDSNYNSGGGNYFDEYDSADYEYAAADYDYSGGLLNYMAPGEIMELSDLSAESGSGASVLPADRKIIRDANITMEVEDVELSYDNILKLLSSFGGYEAKRDMHSNYKDYPTVSATLKIPANKLDTFLTDIKKEGETISSSITSSDITDQYYDSKIRITTLEKTLDNYYEFLENAKDVDEQLRVTRYINDITQEIEQLKGSIKRWDSLVDYSTVTLNLYRPYEAPVPEPEPREINWNSLSLEDMGWFISSGFLSVCNAIFSVLQWIVIAIATISPVVIPGAIILVVLIRRHMKKNKIKNKNDNSENSVA